MYLFLNRKLAITYFSIFLYTDDYTSEFNINMQYPRRITLVNIIISVMLITATASLYITEKALALGPVANIPQCNPKSPKPQPLSTKTTNQTLSVRGTIDLANSTVKLDPFMILPGAKYTSRPANSSFSITLLDNNRNILARYPFDPKSTLMSQNKDKSALLSEAVPYVGCTKQIVISKGNIELASRHVDDYMPKVSFISIKAGENATQNIVLRWKATDMDDGNLTYFILYSTDAGKSWQTLASDLKYSHLTVNIAALPGSNKAVFRVIATDGVNTGISDSNGTLKVLSLFTEGG